MSKHVCELRADQANPDFMGQTGSGLPVIIARALYNVFWERLPEVLGQLGFTVEGRNRSQGVVEVQSGRRRMNSGQI